tara:strand:- start:717 stop:1922 length:1206 start_codon:yes stop_codon:yes gene_type:complete
MNEIVACEVCGNGSLISVLDLGFHPMCDDLIPINESRVCNKYPIKIYFCEECCTAHQRFQIPKNVLFPESYHYRAHLTPSVLSGMRDLVGSFEQRFGPIDGKIVLDIGCNDGSLLDIFYSKGCSVIGIEPTSAALDSKHKILNCFFDKESTNEVLSLVGQPDIITFTNVFAHIENLIELLDNLKLLIGDNTVVVIENHYLGSVLQTDQFDTFYHEHPRTYSLKSFQYISKSLGLNLQDVQFVSRYGGNIRAYLGHEKEVSTNINEGNFVQLFNTMNRNLLSWKTEILALINSLVDKYGPLTAKAFPGRAAIIIEYLGLNESHLSAVYEITGSKKVGYYVPGTKIPILPEAELFSKKDLPDIIINLAWHIPTEVNANLCAHGFNGKMINIKDFPVQKNDPVS